MDGKGLEDPNLLPGASTCDYIGNVTLDSVVDGKVQKFNLLYSSKHIKNVLLMFYPVDFGFVSPSQFYQIADIKDELEKLNCEVVAVSTEHIPSMLKFTKAPREIAGIEDVKIRLVSDPQGELMKTFGIYKPEENIAFKSVFLLNTEMEVICYEKVDHSNGINFEYILGALKDSSEHPASCAAGDIVCLHGSEMKLKTEEEDSAYIRFNKLKPAQKFCIVFWFALGISLILFGIIGLLIFYYG